MGLRVQIIPGLSKLGFVFLFLVPIVFEGDFQKMKLESSMLSHHNPENHGGDILALAVKITIQTFEKKYSILKVGLFAPSLCSAAVLSSAVLSYIRA